MIPAPVESTIAWTASPTQRARWTQAAANITRVRCKPFTQALPKPVGSPSEEAPLVAEKQYPRLADHWFVAKKGRTLSDSAIHLLRLKGWLEICRDDRRFDSEVYETECRLREQATFIIGWCA